MYSVFMPCLLNRSGYALLTALNLTLLGSPESQISGVMISVVKQTDKSDWTVSDWFWNDIQHSFGPLFCDRFASADNALLPIIILLIGPLPRGVLCECICSRLI